MGAAGDMLLAALLELCPEPEGFVEKLNALKIPGVAYKMEKSVKCGVTGTHMSVLVDGMEEKSMDAHMHSHGEQVQEPHTHNHGEQVQEPHTHSPGEHMQEPHGHSQGEHTQESHGHSQGEHMQESHGHSHGEQVQEPHGHRHEGHVHEHSHASMREITRMITHLELPEAVKQDAIQVYRLIAEAESHVHDTSIEEIHFHEVGTMDAVADIVGVCYLMHELDAGQIVTSPIHVGSGQVHCAHGILPVPAPATAYILRGVPVYSGEIRGELCTPTGAALLKHFSTSFGPMPVMCIEKIGYGMGRKDFKAANCVRVMLGEDML